MKLVYKLNSPKKGSIFYYCGYSVIKINDLIAAYPISIKTAGNFISVGEYITPTDKIVVFTESDDLNDEYLEYNRNKLEIEYIQIETLSDIKKHINTEVNKLKSIYPFPEEYRSGTSNGGYKYKRYKDIDPSKKQHERWGARNFKSKIKI